MNGLAAVALLAGLFGPCGAASINVNDGEIVGLVTPEIHSATFKMEDSESLQEYAPPLRPGEGIRPLLVGIIRKRAASFEAARAKLKPFLHSSWMKTSSMTVGGVSDCEVFTAHDRMLTYDTEGALHHQLYYAPASSRGDSPFVYYDLVIVGTRHHLLGQLEYLAKFLEGLRIVPPGTGKAGPVGPCLSFAPAGIPTPPHFPGIGGRAPKPKLKRSGLAPPRWQSESR